MHKAVVFAFATAVAAAAAALMLPLLPDSTKMAYGEPLPYLKATREGDRLKIWLEDFAGLRPGRVWLYVNGELKASGGPGTSVYARCGDRVAALAQYEAGVRRVEAEILCTKPVKARDVEETRDYHSYILTQAYRAATGDVDETGAPVELSGDCFDVDGYLTLTIRALRRDVLVCAGTVCDQKIKFRWNDWQVNEKITLYVFKVPTAPAAQVLGGGVIELHVKGYTDRYSWADLYVNGVKFAECWSTGSSEVRGYTEYQEPNATGVYHTRMQWEDGTTFDGTLVVYDRGDGTFGFRVHLNPVAGGSAGSLEHAIDTRYGELRFTIDPITGANEYFGNGPLARFYDYIRQDENARDALAEALRKASGTHEYNVPYIAVERQEVVVYHTGVGSETRTELLEFKVLNLQSLGAVLANAYIPLDIRLPPVKSGELPPLNPPANSTQPGNNPPANATNVIVKSYLFTYR